MQFRITNPHDKRVRLCQDISKSRQRQSQSTASQGPGQSVNKKIRSIKNFWDETLILVLFQVYQYNVRDVQPVLWTWHCHRHWLGRIACWEWQVQATNTDFYLFTINSIMGHILNHGPRESLDFDNYSQAVFFFLWLRILFCTAEFVLMTNKGEWFRMNTITA